MIQLLPEARIVALRRTRHYRVRLLRAVLVSAAPTLCAARALLLWRRGARSLPRAVLGTMEHHRGLRVRRDGDAVAGAGRRHRAWARTADAVLGFHCGGGITASLRLLPAFRHSQVFISVPVYNLFRASGRHMFQFTFALGILAGLGLSALAKLERRVAWRAVIISSALMVAAVTAAVIVYVFFDEQLVENTPLPPEAGALAQSRHLLSSRLLCHQSGLAVAGAMARRALSVRQRAARADALLRPCCLWVLIRVALDQLQRGGEAGRLAARQIHQGARAGGAHVPHHQPFALPLRRQHRRDQLSEHLHRARPAQRQWLRPAAVGAYGGFGRRDDGRGYVLEARPATAPIRV